jgi:hypothetical protein
MIRVEKALEEERARVAAYLNVESESKLLQVPKLLRVLLRACSDCCVVSLGLCMCVLPVWWRGVGSLLVLYPVVKGTTLIGRCSCALRCVSRYNIGHVRIEIALTFL